MKIIQNTAAQEDNRPGSSNWDRFERISTNCSTSGKRQNGPRPQRIVNCAGKHPRFNSVTLDGGSTYRRGAMYEQACFEYQLASAQAMGSIVPPSVTQIINGVLRAIIDYNNEDAVSTLVGDFYASVVEVEDARSVSKQPRPPQRLTEATLLTAMETAGRNLDEKELSDAMRETGLGTPATRASIGSSVCGSRR